MSRKPFGAENRVQRLKEAREVLFCGIAIEREQARILAEALVVRIGILKARTLKHPKKPGDLWDFCTHMGVWSKNFYEEGINPADEWNFTMIFQESQKAVENWEKLYRGDIGEFL
jgi:hypothetical protein